MNTYVSVIKWLYWPLHPDHTVFISAFQTTGQLQPFTWLHHHNGIKRYAFEISLLVYFCWRLFPLKASDNYIPLIDLLGDVRIPFQNPFTTQLPQNRFRRGLLMKVFRQLMRLLCLQSSRFVKATADFLMRFVIYNFPCITEKSSDMIQTSFKKI